MSNVLWARFVLAAVLTVVNGCDSCARYWRERTQARSDIRYELSPRRVMLRVGESQEFKLEKIPVGPNRKDLTEETVWSSKDPAVAVSKSGDPGQKFTAVRAGVTSVTAEAEGHSFSTPVVVISTGARRQGCVEIQFRMENGGVGLALQLDGNLVTDGPRGEVLYSLVDQEMPVRVLSRSACVFEGGLAATPAGGGGARKLASLQTLSGVTEQTLTLNFPKLSRFDLYLSPKGRCDEDDVFALRDSPARFTVVPCGDP